MPIPVYFCDRCGAATNGSPLCASCSAGAKAANLVDVFERRRRREIERARRILERR